MHDENIYYSANHYDYSTGQTLPYTSTRKTATQQRSKKEVLAIQQNLNRKGYLGKNGKKLVVDGIWGENTAYAHNAYTLDVQKQTAKQKQTASDPLNTQLKQLAENKVSKPLASSSHVQSVLKDNTRSQQEQEDILQRAMDTKPDYLAGLRDLLNDTKKQKSPQDELLELIGYKAPESVSSSSHVQSVLKDQTLSRQEQEDRLQRAMDAIQTKADERERARKSANPLDAILYYNDDPGKSQTEREEDYLRALQHLLQPDQTESEYRQEYRYLDTINRTAENNKNRYLSYQKALDQKLNQSSDPLYVLERSLKRYSPTQYSQEELGQIYDRAAKQIIPEGQTESTYRNRVVIRESVSNLKSPYRSMTDKQWQNIVYQMRVDGQNLSNWFQGDYDTDPNNCYYWALGIWTPQISGLRFTTNKHGPGILSGAEITPDEIQAVLKRDGTYDERKLNDLMDRLDNSFMADAEALGYSVRPMATNLMNLNVYGDDAQETLAEYRSTDYRDRHMTEIGHKQKLGQRVEDIILEDLNPDETLIVMAIYPENIQNTIHFYRRDPNGVWSEKPGKNPLYVGCPDPFVTPENRINDGTDTAPYKIITAFAIS